MTELDIVGKAFPFKLNYKYHFFYIDLPENTDIFAWMLENLKGEWDYYHVEGGGSVGQRKQGTFDSVMEPVIIVAIDLEEDAALFKLRWI